MARPSLTPEQAEVSDRIDRSLRKAAEADLRQLADLPWWEHWRQRLKYEGGEAVLQGLRASPPDGREAVRRLHGEVAGYFANQVHRMDYPRYRARGWTIGSGPIESACKRVIGKRMKNGACVGARTGPIR